MEFDITWKNPTEMQVAAFEHAERHVRFWVRKNGRKRFMSSITEFDIAEMMCMAESSLWYTQAKSWADGGDVPAENLREVFKLAGNVIVRLVELGYSDGKWYDARQLWPETSILALNLTAIVEVARVLRIVSARTLQVNSAWFQILPHLMIPGLDVEKAITALGKTPDSAQPGAFVVAQIKSLYDPEFKKTWNAAARKAKNELSQTYEPVACIHPRCENPVAPPKIEPREGHFKNYRATWACRKGHNSFYCTRCKKPHSFVSKVGKAHYSDYYGKDWDGTDMEGKRV